MADIYLSFKDRARYSMNVVMGPEGDQCGLALEDKLSPVLGVIDTLLHHVSSSRK